MAAADIVLYVGQATPANIQLRVAGQLTAALLAQPKHRKPAKRRLRLLRRLPYALPVVAPSNLSWVATRAARLRIRQKRPLWRLFFDRLRRKDRYPYPVVAPSNLSWYTARSARLRKRQVRPLWRLLFDRLRRKDRYPLPVVASSNLSWVAPRSSRLRKQQRRPLWRFFAWLRRRDRYPLPIVTPSDLSWYAARRRVRRKRPARFARVRLPFASAVQLLLWLPPRRRPVRKRAGWRLLLDRMRRPGLVIVGGAIQQASEWLIRARRRGRR